MYSDLRSLSCTPTTTLSLSTANATVDVMRNTTAESQPGSRSSIVIARFGDQSISDHDHRNTSFRAGS